MKIYTTVTDLGRVQDFFYDFQKSTTQKLRKGEQSLLCGKLCHDLIYISIKYPGYCLWTTDGRRHAIISPVFFQNGRIK